jgi:hypothetical protein
LEIPPKSGEAEVNSGFQSWSADIERFDPNQANYSANNLIRRPTGCLSDWELNGTNSRSLRWTGLEEESRIIISWPW